MSDMHAKYTMTFHDFLSGNSEWWDSKFTFGDSNQTVKLKDSLKSMWDFYEIGGETVGEFELMLLDTLKEHEAYYLEALLNYEKEYDYSKATVKTSKGSNVSKHVELPNKQISEKDMFDYPSMGDKIESESSVDNPAIFLGLKAQYMAQLRNLYREFASRFSDCFIHIF